MSWKKNIAGTPDAVTAACLNDPQLPANVKDALKILLEMFGGKGVVLETDGHVGSEFEDYGRCMILLRRMPLHVTFPKSE